VTDEGVAITRRSAAGGVVVAEVRGEIDLTSAYALEEALTAAAAESGDDGGAAPRVVVDLAEVTFMDSSGLNALLRTHRAVQARGGTLALAGAQQTVARLLEMTGLEEVIPVFPGVDEAIEA
jgi:anti-anti-sigma factor